jgi:SRSO17 transposase
MTPAQIEALGPAFADYLRQFLFCCGYTQTFDLLNVYCRGFLSDLDRKTCEPMALAAGVAVRTLQEFLKDHLWSFERARGILQRHVARELPGRPADDLGTVGIVDETGTAKKGTHTPGVQRQWCGEVGKQENCVDTVHLAVSRGHYKTLVDADLFLPRSWDQGRGRCRAAGIPDEIVYRPKWQIALGQRDRARASGLALDWLTFDEGYGDKPGFLRGLDERRLPYVGEVPKSFRCWARRPRPGRAGHRADDLVRHSPAFRRQPARHFRLHHQTTGDSVWEAKAARVWVSGAGGAAALADLGAQRGDRGGEVLRVRRAGPGGAGAPAARGVQPLECGALHPGEQRGSRLPGLPGAKLCGADAAPGVVPGGPDLCRRPGGQAPGGKTRR